MFYLTHKQTLADQHLFADGYEQYVEDTRAGDVSVWWTNMTWRLNTDGIRSQCYRKCGAEVKNSGLKAELFIRLLASCNTVGWLIIVAWRECSLEYSTLFLRWLSSKLVFDKEFENCRISDKSASKAKNLPKGPASRNQRINLKRFLEDVQVHLMFLAHEQALILNWINVYLWMVMKQYVKRAYDKDVRDLTNQYSVEIECEVVNGYISKLINNWVDNAIVNVEQKPKIIE